jgi:septal ring factor EnvC (AmiA/AmiB activator)
MAFAALVAGCINVDVPRAPYVNVVATGVSKTTTYEQQKRISQMDRRELEDEFLRLAGQNDSLRIQVDDLKRELKTMRADRDKYKNDADDLRDQVKDLRKR